MTADLGHQSQAAQAGPSSHPEIEKFQSQFQILDNLAIHPTSGRNQAAAAAAAGTPASLISNSVSPNASLERAPVSESTQNKTSVSRPEQGLLVSQRSEKEEFQDIFSELMTGTEHEIAFLTRHFAEIIGPWLDLSDSKKFFSVYVPIRAINSPSLKHAIAALAAKQLGRVKGAKLSTGGGMFTSPATTEMYPNAAQTDWFLKAANYYYMAASDMSNSASFGYTTASSSAVLESPIEMVRHWLNRALSQGDPQDLSDGNILRKTEEIMATAVLLTLYKLFDADGDQWHTSVSRDYYFSEISSSQFL